MSNEALDAARPETATVSESRRIDSATSGRPSVRKMLTFGRKRWQQRTSKPGGRARFVTAFVFAAVLLVVIGHFISSRMNQAVAQAPPQENQPAQTTRPATPEKSGGGFWSLFEDETLPAREREPIFTTAARIVLRLAIAALLGALLAFRPRKDVPMLQRNPYVAHTQILLAVVAAALMMTVADNAARAFAIFAAASLVRFRTNIRDPKEITVLLVSLGVGLAAGVGKLEIAIILSLFVLLILSLLEYYEPELVFRSMELTVTTRKLEETDEVLREVFEKRNIVSELRKIDREDGEHQLGKIVYFVNVSGELSTDKLSEEIFNADPENVDSIHWDQKKTSSYSFR